MAAQKIELNQENAIKLLNTIQENMLEERSLALDRFRRQDDNIDNNEQFFLQGKILAEYLRVASDRTDALLNIAKLQMGIVFKDELVNTSSSLSDEEIKKQIQKQLSEANLTNDNDIKK